MLAPYRLTVLQEKKTDGLCSEPLTVLPYSRPACSSRCFKLIFESNQDTTRKLLQEAWNAGGRRMKKVKEPGALTVFLLRRCTAARPCLGQRQPPQDLDQTTADAKASGKNLSTTARVKTPKNIA